MREILSEDVDPVRVQAIDTLGSNRLRLEDTSVQSTDTPVQDSTVTSGMRSTGNYQSGAEDLSQGHQEILPPDVYRG